MLNFPSSPINGQEYDNWVYNTAKGAWLAKPLEPMAAVPSPVAPSTPQPGDMWFNTNEATTYVYYDDGNTSQWVEMVAQTGLTSPLAVTQGGTGATTVAGAQSALGVKVIQVLHSYVNTSVTNNSSTWVDTGASVTITPTASTSKILIFAIQPASIKNTGNANSGLNVRLLRDATMLETHTNMGYTGVSSDNRFGSADFAFMDSPATTSAVTYKTQLSNNFNGVGVSIARAMLVVMEIKA